MVNVNLFLIIFLILFPLLPAVLLLPLRSGKVVRMVVNVSIAVMSATAIAVAVLFTGGITHFISLSHHLDKFIIAGDIIIALVFMYLSRNHRSMRYWIPLLVIPQYCIVLFFELTGKIPESSSTFFIDNLTVIMILIIAIVGGLISIYTPGYMDKYHEEHPEIKDRRHIFIFAVFLFFFAMFGIVLSNQLTWIYFFWEITTLCSFIMIGYSQKEEAVRNSFRALWMLLLGGAGFAVAIIYASLYCDTIEITKLTVTGKTAALIPAMFMCFAGFNKAAQFPFSSWLLGAMVAPTPSSALLHSSTMVKAGVYICIRFSPAIHNTACGTFLAFVGAISFFAASAIAISQSDGKRVLAYSTVANLGLIVLCAGVGSYLALWSAILLIIFHALAKALMFCCVGMVDHQTGSRNIESMHGLMPRMPFVTIMMIVGISGMFLAPFGMLISKWSVLEALAQNNPILPLIVILGSALTLFFWGKWMGTLVAVNENRIDVEKGIEKGIWFPLFSLAVLTIIVCAIFPLIGTTLIEPMYGPGFTVMGQGRIIMVIIMMSMVMLLPVGFFINWRSMINVTPYLGGTNVSNPHRFKGSLKEEEWTLKNYYFEHYFGENKLLKISNIAAILITAAFLTIGWFL